MKRMIRLFALVAVLVMALSVSAVSFAQSAEPQPRDPAGEYTTQVRTEMILAPGVEGFAAPAASSRTIVCGIDVYNNLGLHVATLQQNVNVDFLGATETAPANITSANPGSTWAGVNYGWENLSGPTINGLTSVISGQLVFYLDIFTSNRVTYTTTVSIDSNGWYCQK